MRDNWVYVTFFEDICLQLFIQIVKGFFKLLFPLFIWILVEKLANYMISHVKSSIHEGYYFGDKIESCKQSTHHWNVLAHPVILFDYNFLSAAQPNYRFKYNSVTVLTNVMVLLIEHLKHSNRGLINRKGALFFFVIKAFRLYMRRWQYYV